MFDADVLIIGAGLTGLRAAVELTRAGLSVLMIEQEASAGGRVRTTMYDGFQLDHGFQILLTSYPELRRLEGLQTLQLKPFMHGARIRHNGRFHDLFDPRHHPTKLLTTICSKLYPHTTRDRLRDIVALLRLFLTQRAQEVLHAGMSTAELLAKLGITSQTREHIITPFLGGVLLDPELRGDAGITRFYLTMFASGRAVLPEYGVQALPNLLVEKIGSSHVLTRNKAISVAPQQVVLESGESLSAKRVICAVDGMNAALLQSSEQSLGFYGTTTLYFAAPQPPFSEPILVLNGDGNGPINNLSVQSNVHQRYAAGGGALIAISTIGSWSRFPEEKLRTAVVEQLTNWYGNSVHEWRYLRSFILPEALPARPRLTNGWKKHNGIYYAGDFLSYGSQNGALGAGRAVAEAILNE
jgi:phytoene dehydrogenase-like protein